MALTVETGEGLADADSLVELADVRAFATARGKTLDAEDAVVEAQIRNAHDFLMQTEPRLRGTRTVETQSLPFPRQDLVVRDIELADDEVPADVKTAMCLLVLGMQDIDPFPIRETRNIVQETIGPIQTTYRNVSSSPLFPQVEAYLAPFYTSAGILRSLRV